MANLTQVYNPWLSNFRIVLQKGDLMFIDPSGTETKLVMLDKGRALFRLGEDEHEPESIRFDTVVNSHALRATIAGGDYYHTFTP
jgi:hypothetical protein